MDALKKIIPIDLFSKKRLFFNIIIFSIHTIIFCFSFIISFIFYSYVTSAPFPSKSLLLTSLPIIISVKFMIFSFFNFKRISHFSLSYYDTFKTAILILLSFFTLVFFSFLIQALSEISLGVYSLDTFFSFSLILLYHFLFVNMNRKKNIFFNDESLIRTLIIGAGTTAEVFTQTLRRKKNPVLHIVGYVDDNINKIGMRINGIKIWGPISNIENIIRKTKAQKVLIAIPKASRKLIYQIIQTTKDLKIGYSIIPSTEDIVMGKIKLDNVRDIEVEDLLKRDKLYIDVSSVDSVIKNRTVMVTGAAGSIGSEICKQAFKYNPKSLIAIDQAETALFYLERYFQNKYDTFIPIIVDITNKERIANIFKTYNPDVIFHAAAYKHVPMMEKNVQESFLNNVLGTKTVADEAYNNNSKLFVMISTDKAVNPTSIMGLTKRIAEKYIQSLNSRKKTKFITIRFGNVLDSSGNVINIFKEQINKGGPVTITHKDMKRYFMLTEEAVQLVLQAASFGNGGDIYILDMGEPVIIEDLAKTMIKLSGLEVNHDIKIEYSEPRPGEKLFEELSYNDNESICHTPHEKIFAYNSNDSNPEVTIKLVNKLIDNIYSNGNFEKISKSLVPEYYNENGIF